MIGRVCIGDLKNRNGITLIALIVTIIVLLILAGVSIATITGENGLLQRAQLAEERTKKVEDEENLIIEDYENKIGEIMSGSRDKIRELTFVTDSRSSCSIPSGIKELYVIFSTSTNANELIPSISSSIITSQEQIVYSSAVDNYGNNLRSSLRIYKVNLSGEEGTINMSASGGSGTYRAWTAVVAY